MRILQVVDIAYEAGGAEKSVRLIRDQLRAQGHDVLVLSTDKHAPGHELFADVLVPVISGSAAQRLWRHFWYAAGYRQVRAVVRDFKPDVVHLHTISEFSPSLLWALGKTPATLTVHGPEEFTGRLLPWLLPASDYRDQSYQRHDLRLVGRLRYTYYYCLQRPAYLLALRRLKLVIAPSKYMAGTLTKDFRHTPIKQIYNGIKLLPQAPLPLTPEVLYVGRLEAVKGVEHLIRAFAEVRRQVPDAKLRIVGDGGQRADLQRLTESLGLEKTVELPGWVLPEHIAAEFAAAQMLAIPSVWPENLPTVAIEALAVGRPIVGSDTGGIAELVDSDQNGRIVPVGDEAALATAISQLLSDKHQLQKASEAAAAKARQFELNTFVKNLLIVYNDISHENSAR